MKINNAATEAVLRVAVLIEAEIVENRRWRDNVVAGTYTHGLYCDRIYGLESALIHAKRVLSETMYPVEATQPAVKLAA